MGNIASIDPTYCGGKKIFKKSYEGVIHLEKRAKNAGATGAIRTLFAPANKDDADKLRRDSAAQLETTAENAMSFFVWNSAFRRRQCLVASVKKSGLHGDLNLIFLFHDSAGRIG